MSDHHLTSPKALDELFLYRLARLMAVAGAPVVRLCEGKYGITRREWRLIVALAAEGSLLSSQLAQRVKLTRARTSKAVSELVDKQLATRTPRPHDRRLVDIELTPAGRQIHEALMPEVIAINQSLLSDFSRQDLEQLDSLMNRLQQAADERIEQGDLPKAARRRGRRASADAQD